MLSSRKNSLEALLMSQEVWTELSGRGYEYTVSITVSSFMNIQCFLLEKGARTTLCLISMLFIRLMRSCQIVKVLRACLSFSPLLPYPFLFGGFSLKNRISVCVF